MMSSNSKRYLNFLAVLFFVCSPALGQENERFTQGVVNDANRLSLGVPLGDYQGRGIDLPVSLSYSSSVWRLDHRAKMYDPAYGSYHNVTEAIFSEHSVAGWKSSLDLPRVEFPKLDEVYNFNGLTSGNCRGWRVARVTIYMPDGATYQLRKSDVPHNLGYVDKTGTFYSVDGSRVKFESADEDTWTLYLPDGTRYYFNGGSAQVIDRHGNTLIYNGGTRTWTDTLGREIEKPFPTTPSVGETEYTLPGLNGVNGGQILYKFKWAELDDALTNPADQLRYMAQRYMASPFPQWQAGDAGHLFHDAFGYDIDEGQPHPYNTVVVGRGEGYGMRFNPVVLTEITLPDNSKYKFSYNVYGEIDKVVYPTNASGQYEYESPEVDTVDEGVKSKQPYVQAERRIKTRGVSENGTGTDLIEWEYDFDYYGGKTTTIAPDGSKAETYKYVSPLSSLGHHFGFEGGSTVGMVYEKKVFSATDVLLRRELTKYEQTTNQGTITGTCSNGYNYSTTVTAGRNARVQKTVSLIFESGSTSALAQVSTFGYETTYASSTGVDQNLAQTYHFTVLSNPDAASVSIDNISPGALARKTETTYSANSTYRETKHILGVPTIVKIKDSAGTVVSQSEMSYDDSGYVPSGTTNAMPTSMRTWDSTKGTDSSNPFNQLVTRAKFDSYGNRTEATDAKGYTTTTTYDATYQAYPVSVTSPIPDPSGIYGSNTAFTSTTTYDPVTGSVLSATDANGQTSTMEYNDPLLRPTKAIASNGHQTTTEYGAGTSEATRYVKVRSQIDADKWSEAISRYDGMGRAYQTEKIDSQGNIFTKTEYDIMGRVKRSTNPYKTGEAELWSTPEYDDLSRTKKVTSPDTTNVQIVYGLSTTGVIGTTKTITDQAGKKRSGIADALGNTVRVIEDPDGQNLLTDYVFDTLGNLRKTTQGEQNRYFSYDSLGRVLFAKQPEQDTNAAFTVTDPISGNTGWSVKYLYDDNGNITTTTDARNISITGTYDRFNRLITRDYSDPATPDVSFYYDGRGLGSIPNFSKGKTTKVTSSVSETRNTSFDAMGRLLASEQRTTAEQLAGNQAAYAFSYIYNLSGALIEETYPSGRVVKNTLNADGELTQVQSKKNANYGYFTYADSFTYNSAGAVTKMQLGNGRWETASFNDRLQVTQIGLGLTDSTQDLLKLEFKYNTTGQTDNNGSMREQKITVPTVGANPGFTATQTYAYDSLNRLQSATENISTQTWKQTFDYDRYGNREFDAANTTTLGTCPQKQCNPLINTSDNRLKKDQDADTLVDYDYDANGALIKDVTGQRGYDAESHQKEFFSASNSSGTPDATYIYDGEGKRVKKISGSETTIFVYNASGQLAAEYSTTVVPQSQAKVSYLTTDHLGSPRIITDQNGAVTSRKDFTAFGEEVISPQRIGGTNGNGYDPPNVRQDYTGYQKDGESGLEFAQARYYNTTHGRFTSVDPLTASATIPNPQTFNRYSYVINSPYKFVDPLGLALQDIGVVQTDNPWLARELNNVAHNNLMGQARAQEAREAANSAAWRQAGEQAEHEMIESDGAGTVTAEATVDAPDMAQKSQPAAQVRQAQTARRAAAARDRLRNNRRPRRNNPEPMGPGLNETNQQRSAEEALREVILVPAGPPNMVKFPGPSVKHHIFPQAGEFAQYFRRAGIDIHQYTVSIPNSQHIQLHSGIGLGRGGLWNNQWKQFFEANRRATPSQIFNQANMMIANLAINGRLVPYRNPAPYMQAR